MHPPNVRRIDLARIGCVAILAVNLLLAAFMYQTAGWYYLRGYNEVVNFVVVPAALMQAGLDLLIAAPIAAVGRWRRARGGRFVLAGLLVSAVLVALSPLFAPSIGRFAAHHLWIETPLVEAARYGDARLVEILLANGADPNARQPALGYTALHYMVSRNEHAAVKALLATGADPNAQAQGLETPLHWAVRSYANGAIIETLIKHGADPKLKDWENKSPIDYALLESDARQTEVFTAMGRPDYGHIGEGQSRP
ncbi:MAG: ankyrin repeat domain-containing protein [Pirellulales bacterium]